jgi:[ribosomal protein S5]-alanine N-acetyltransferase
VFELQRLGPEHAAAVLAFERENRAYFAQSISDRGDEFFEDFAAQYEAALDEQDSGVSAFHVLVEADGTVVGRVNLYEVADGSAELGYRVAERVSGRGAATSGVRTLCRLATQDYGLRTLRAGISNENAASRRVLEKAGFVPIGLAVVGGRPGERYELDLAQPG